MKNPIFFAIPGDINSLTGGYGYDRRLFNELKNRDLNVQLISLANSFPNPDSSALEDADKQLTRLPDNAVVIIDGLAFGVMHEIAEQQAKRLKLIALCHHPLALESGLGANEIQRLQKSEQIALAAARAVIVTSNNTARTLNQQFAISTNKITVALPGTDRQNFATCEGNPPILLTVATLTQRKAHDILIEALVQIAHLPWQARFVGGAEFDPEWTAYLQNKVASYALEHRINFVGNVSNIFSEYAQADIFVLPSLFEGYGMAFAEALSFGLPIVAARSGAVSDLVPESAGILVRAGDADALANSISQLLSDKTKCKQLQVGAQQAANNLPTWTDTAEIVSQLIQQLVRQ